MIDGDRFLQGEKEYRGSVAGFCRACKETETFDRFQVTVTDLLLSQTLTRRVKVCIGCGYEQEEETK